MHDSNFFVKNNPGTAAGLTLCAILLYNTGDETELQACQLMWLACPPVGKGWRSHTLEKMENFLEFNNWTILQQAGLPSGKWLAEQQPCWRGPGHGGGQSGGHWVECEPTVCLSHIKQNAHRATLGETWLAGQDSYYPLHLVVKVSPSLGAVLRKCRQSRTRLCRWSRDWSMGC